MALTNLSITAKEIRNCGECTACCSFHEISGFKGDSEKTSPSREPCFYQCSSPEGSCTIYNDRPQMCKSFECSWLQGFGKDGWRPDKSQVMFSIREESPDQIFGIAVELSEGSLVGPGRNALVAFARKLPFPVICASADAKPPHDSGDWVAVRNDHLGRSKSMTGALIERLAEDVGLYELVKVS